MKKVISYLLFLLLAVNLMAPVSFADDGAAVSAENSSEGININTIEEFLDFSQSCFEDTYSKDKIFLLNTDIDLTGKNFKPIPYFAGVFKGQNHSITGLNFTEDGSRQGLFRVVAEGAEIRDLRVSGIITPSGTAGNIGGIAGVNGGLIQNCSYEGTVSGINSVGGIAGYNSGKVYRCSFDGSISGEHMTGGIIGKNTGTAELCRNLGKVNTVYVIPKGDKSFDISQLSQEDILNITDIGGITGRNSGKIAKCTNKGPVGYMYTGYNVGGIAGYSSGYISGSSNNAEINGRKDVGGIAGQLQPYTEWDFDASQFNALKNSIGSLDAALNNASYNATIIAGDLAPELTSLNGYTSQTIYELEAVINQINNGNGVVYDPETGSFDYVGSGIDTSSLSASLNNLYAEIYFITEIINSGVQTATSDLSTVTAQMRGVFNQLTETATSAAIVDFNRDYDISFEKANDITLGAISECESRGTVIGESCAGGIVGNSGFEIAFDMEDDLDLSAAISDARRNVFAVVRNCKSSGDIQTRSSKVGGIAGNMDIGAILSSAFAGSVFSESGDYVGGIVGNCSGTTAKCYSRTIAGGEKYVGGIAGNGYDIYDCLTHAEISKYKELAGAIAGNAEGIVNNNLFFAGNPAGIDGISIDGSTNLSSVEEISDENMPIQLSDIYLQFSVNGKIIQTVRVNFGEGIDTLPEVPDDGNRVWRWDDFDKSHIYQSAVITGKYTSPISTISTSEEVPLFLAEGNFTDDQKLVAIPYSGQMPEGREYTAYTLTLSGETEQFTVRMHTDSDGKLYRISTSQKLEELQYSRDGSYIVFKIKNGDTIALAENTSPKINTYVIVAIAAVLVAVVAVILVRRKQKTNNNSAQDSIE